MKNDEFCIKNDGFCIKMMNFALKTQVSASVVGCGAVRCVTTGVTM